MSKNKILVQFFYHTNRNDCVTIQRELKLSIALNFDKRLWLFYISYVNLNFQGERDVRCENLKRMSY